MKTLAAVLAAAWLSTAPALALERCTRPLIGSGPELGPMVCTEVQPSERGKVLGTQEVPAIAKLYWHQYQHDGLPPTDDPQEQIDRAKRFLERYDIPAGPLYPASR